MIKAYELGKGNVSLLKEVLRCLVKYKRGNDAISIFTAESEAVRNNKRCMFYYITALLQVGELEKAEDLLCGNGNYLIVPDIREGEVSLSQLWLDIQDSKKAAGLPYSDISQLPRELDFRMKANEE